MGRFEELAAAHPAAAAAALERLEVSPLLTRKCAGTPMADLGSRVAAYTTQAVFPDGPPNDENPTCNDREATVYVSADGLIVGGSDDGAAFSGTLRGTTGPDVIVGTSGDDTLIGLQGDDLLCGLGGDDVLRGSAGADSLYGGPGRDELRGDNGPDVLYGGDGDDDLLGGALDDEMYGEAGDDRLQGAAGDDVLRGGDGSDLLLGNGGADSLLGGEGDDDLEGGSGDDTLVGEAGTDSARGGGGTDACEAETELSCETDPGPPVDLGADVRPVLECVANGGDGAYTAFFGYENLYGEPVSVPRGPQNALSPASLDGQQPTTFDVPGAVPGRPGRTPFYPGHAFAVTFGSGERVVWTLGGRTSTASDDPAQRCQD